MDKITQEDKKRLSALLDYEIVDGKSDLELMAHFSNRAIGYGLLLQKFKDTYENARGNFTEITEIFNKYNN